MTTYRLMDGVSGRPGTGSSGTQPPASATAFTGNYVTGLSFFVSSGGLWFQGYWWYVPATNGVTAPSKFCLYEVTGSAAGTVVTGSVVTSGTLSAGWNFVTLTTPLLLTVNTAYTAAVGMSSVSPQGFPLTSGQFGSAQPYSGGITNGPLTAYSSTTGTLPVTSSWLPQQPFSTASSDPTTGIPATNDANDLLWVDVQVTDQAPAGAAYRAFPNLPKALGYAVPSTSVNYTLGMQFSLTQACKLLKLWHYSPAGVTILPARTAVWDAGSQAVVSGTDNPSPSWLVPGGGAASAGGGWMYVDYSAAGVTLAPGKQYKAARFSSPTSTAWLATTVGYYTTGTGQNGITQGPLTVPNNASASPGQDSYLQSSTWGYPVTTANGENTWGDIEVQPVTASSGLLAAGII